MGLIKIIALNGTEIEYVKESLTIKKENNAFSTEFKVSYSSFPFLIIEDSTTKETLGNRDITSLNKKKIVDVIIEESGVIYYGQIQQLSFVNGFRKANLKYSSKLLTILNKKLSEFMPTVSVIPDETTPEPYSEITDIEVLGGNYWETYPMTFLSKSFPEVKFQFPKMVFNNKFGSNLVVGDEWYYYEGFINNSDETNFIINYYSVSGSVLTIYNKNVASPQLYLLSILFYALESIGYAITGEFYTDAFISKLLIYSNKNNFYKPKSKYPPEIFAITDTTWEPFSIPSWGDTFLSNSYTFTAGGKYRIEYDFTIPISSVIHGNHVRFFYKISSSPHLYFVFSNLVDIVNERRYKGFFEMEVAAGSSVEFMYLHDQEIRFSFNEFKIYDISLEKVNLMHPSIDLGRYAPDITFATYLNELKKIFNLKIDVDDYKKELNINFNENNVFDTPTILNRSFNLDSYDIVANTSFILKYANETDLGIFVTIDDYQVLGIQKDDFTKSISFGFKQVPNNGYTANLSEAVDKKQGIGLMIYDPENAPYISNEYQGQTLDINGDGGIYDVYFKKWLKFRLSASGVDLSGSFTKTETNILSKSEDIYIDKQHYKIVSLEISEESESFFKVKLNLESINF